MQKPPRPNRAAWLRHHLLSDWRGVWLPEPGQRKTQEVADLMGAVLKECGLNDRLQLEEVQEAWREIVGDFLFQHSRPDSIHRGVLQIRLLQPAVHHALMMEKGRIVNRLQQRFSAMKIKDVRFKHG